MPLPQNEKGGIRLKIREYHHIYSFDRHSQTKARKF